MLFFHTVRNQILGVMLLSISLLSATTPENLTQEEQTERYIKIMPAILFMLLNDDKPLEIEGSPAITGNIYDIYSFLPTVDHPSDRLTF